MKIKLLTAFLLFATFAFSTNSFAALQAGNSVVLAGTSPNINFSETAVGAGLSIGVRFNLAEDIFTDSEEKNITRDHIFTELEAFGNQFFSGEIKQNFGGRLNLGYEFFGVRVFGSGGYVVSTFDYQEQGSASQSASEGAPFFGVGLGYDLTKNIGLRLNSMFYSFDFTPKNSSYQNVEVNVSAVTLGLSVHF
jgi:hypothetical protein